MPAAASYLITGGARIEATLPHEKASKVVVDSGGRLALLGKDLYQKHFFCDWLLGFLEVPGGKVELEVGGERLDSIKARPAIAAVLGRSPLLYGETIQESLLYRTQGVKKDDLYALVERFYGPGLRARTSPQNPLVDPNGNPVPTQLLGAREHLEVAQINVLLQKTPVVVLDLSSELMAQAISEGFRPARELFESGKTVIAILPPDADTAWVEKLTGLAFGSSIRFE